MKKGFIIASYLMSVTFAAAECVELTTELKPLQSSRNVRIAVLLDGRPATHAKVDFCINGAAIGYCSSVVTGDDGVAAPPPLNPGRYNVVAALDGDVRGALYLQVSGEYGTTTLPIDLTNSSRAAQNALKAADKLPIRERLQDFQGVLRDESGGVITSANIKIVRKESGNHTIVRWTKSDAGGHFSTPLDDGIYIAFFLMPGFRTEVVPFEIAAQGKKEVLVKLQVGRC